MAELHDDLRFAARLLRKTPGFTAVALLTLALAIGANTAIFSVVNEVLLQHLPFPEPARLLQVVRRDAQEFSTTLSVPQYAFLSAQPEPFSRLAAYRSHPSGFIFSSGDSLEYLPGTRVTHPFFEVLGLPLLLGRGFLPEEDAVGGPRVVVLSHGLWQHRFGGRPDVVGQSITLNRQPYTIVGVAPPTLQFPEGSQLWTPLQLDLSSPEDAHYLTVMARLTPTIDPAQVAPLLKAQSEQFRAHRPGYLRTNFELYADELQAVRTRNTRPALLLLQGAVGLVLLIACVNLANLQLARVTSRERELAVRTAPQGSLQVGVWRATSGPVGNRTRRLLVVSEVALALILLIGAALLAESFVLLRSVEPGIDPRKVLTLKLSLPEAAYGTPEALESFLTRAQERVRARPGVEAVGFALTLPFETGIRLSLDILDRPTNKSGLPSGGLVLYRPVTRGYFEALKIELKRGRLLDDQDRHGSPLVAVINEAAARHYWPGQDPLGQRVMIGTSIPQIADTEPREIIGVVGDVREENLRNEPVPMVYIPPGQMPLPLRLRSIRLRPQSLLVRTSGEPLPLAAEVQREIQTVDPQLVPTDFSSMEELVSRSLGLQRFNTLLMALLASLALALATVGIYGVLSYLVNQRTRELSVRLALGATPSKVVWLVLRQGMAPVVAGVAVGLAGAFGLTRLLAHLLYSVSTLDPAAFLAAPLMLMGVALAAMVPPAWRASRMNPMEALRTE